MTTLQYFGLAGCCIYLLGLLYREGKKMITTQTAALVAEVERLTVCLRYEQHRAGRRGTHGTDCYKWGPEHYECAMRQADRLTRELAEAKQDATNYRALRDSKGAGDYAICLWADTDEWSALGMPTRDIDARICEFAAMRRTDAGATSQKTL